MRNLTFTILFILVLNSSVTSAVPTADQSQSQVHVATDNLVVKMVGNGNLPMYQFWAPSSDTQYFLQFHSAFEAVDQAGGATNSYDQDHDKRVPQSSVAFPALDWNFSSVIEEKNGSVHFNITSPTGFIQFNNHLQSKDSSSLKFDIIISDYEFHDNTSMLVVAYKFGSLNDTSTSPTQRDDRVQLRDGYVGSELSATTGTGDVVVGFSSSVHSNEIMVYLAYPQFNGTLVHDPTIGLDMDRSASSSTSSAVVDTTDTSSGETTHTKSSGVTNSSRSPHLVGFGFNSDKVMVTTIIATVIAIMVPVILEYTRRYQL